MFDGSSYGDVIEISPITGALHLRIVILRYCRYKLASKFKSKMDISEFRGDGIPVYIRNKFGSCFSNRYSLIGN